MTPENWIGLLAIANVLAIAVTGGVVKALFSAHQKIADLALDVARNYAPNSYVSAVESRIMERLTSMDDKLDKILVAEHHS